MSYTDFILVSQAPITSISESNVWIALGLNSEPEMDLTTAVICKSTIYGKQVQHYYNNGYTSEMIDSTNPAIGLSNAKFVFNGSNIICSFRRQNVIVNSKYFNIVQGRDPYFLTAYSILGGKNYSKCSIYSFFTLIIRMNIKSFKADLTSHDPKNAEVSSKKIKIVVNSSNLSIYFTFKSKLNILMLSLFVLFDTYNM